MNDPVVFLDTNFFARLFLDAGSEHERAALGVLEKIVDGTIVAETHPTVLFELAYVLTKFGDISKIAVVTSIRAVLGYTGILIPNRSELIAASALWSTTGAISFADAFHLALTAATEHKHIFSFDKALSNRIEGVVRVESVAELTAAP